VWESRMLETERGNFEIFEKGEGEPLAVTHLYSEFNRNGNSMAASFPIEKNPFKNYFSGKPTHFKIFHLFISYITIKTYKVKQLTGSNRRPVM